MAALAVVAGCGGSSSPKAAVVVTTAAAAPTTAASTPPTTAADIDYGKQYLTIVGPANAALDKALPIFNDNNSTQAQQAAAVAPVIAAAQASDNALLRAQWPASAVADIKALVAADGPVIADLQQVGSITALNLGSWQTQLATDEGKASAAANIVRADLGLPPPQQS